MLNWTDVYQSLAQHLGDATTDIRLENWEQDVAMQFGGRVSGCLAQLQRLEQKLAEEEGAHNPTPQQMFLEVFHRFNVIPVISAPSGTSLRRHTISHLSNMWQDGINAIINFINERKDQLGIEGSSLIEHVTFPIGVSGAVSVHFHRQPIKGRDICAG